MMAREEQILSEAVKSTGEAYHTDPSVPNLRKWKAAKEALEAFQRDQAEASSGVRFKNLSEVSRWLIREGYKVQERTVRNHHKANLFPAQPGGEFRLQDIEAYAQVHLERPGHADRERDKTSAKDRFLEAQAEEKSLKVAQLKGQLIDAAEEEARDAKLWRSIRGEIEQQAPTVVTDLVERVLALGLPEELHQRLTALVPGLQEEYRESVADIFDRFARDGGVWVEEE
jgi:hypothetical protein